MPTTFRDLIAANKRNSLLLIVLMVLFTIVVALVLSLGILAYVDPGAVSQVRWGEGLLIGFGAGFVAFLVCLASYFQGDRLILAVSGARPIQHADDPQLFNVVEEMAIAAGVPAPRVYLIEDSAPNAFATGRDPRHASVAITTGLRHKLTRDELQGVMAHEMAHIRNYDIRLMLLMAVLIGTIVMLADYFLQMLRFSTPSSRRRKEEKGGSPLAILLFVLALVLAIIAPLLAQIIQFAVSRQREYLADASAVELTRNPLGLASALRKIDADPDILETANRGTAHLYIANPIKKFEARANSVFASHPPIKDRIARLEALAR